ncbi:MAG: hypothetical protein K2L10_04500 [Ruminococcus sp.]|nr:hypothetical protein [Ruminococcus sp.]
MSENIIVADVPVYIFGILTSNVHMKWTRLVCGKSGDTAYRYSSYTYNNFSLSKITTEQIEHIEHTTKEILYARAKYYDCYLADLYDELTMSPKLRKSHQQKDLVVMEFYRFDKKITESECVTKLMKMYQKLIK